MSELTTASTTSTTISTNSGSSHLEHNKTLFCVPSSLFEPDWRKKKYAPAALITHRVSAKRGVHHHHHHHRLHRTLQHKIPQQRSLPSSLPPSLAPYLPLSPGNLCRRAFSSRVCREDPRISSGSPCTQRLLPCSPVELNRPNSLSLSQTAAACSLS